MYTKILIEKKFKNIPKKEKLKCASFEAQSCTPGLDIYIFLKSWMIGCLPLFVFEKKIIGRQRVIC
jgi:hypothetical protein